MKRKRLFLVFGCLLACAALLALWLLRPPAAPPIQRLRFAVVAGEPMRYDQARFDWLHLGEEIHVGEAIAEGRGVALRDRAEMQVRPGRRGRTLVLFPYAVKPLAREKVRLTVVHYQQDRETVLEDIVASEARNGYFSSQVPLANGDTIGVRAVGRGFLVVGQAVLAAIVPPERRQYVFVLAPDTLRGDRVDRRLRPSLRIPNLEALARDAVFFENAVAPSSWTLPSFASIFSGEYEFRHQVSPTTPLASERPHLLAGLATKFASVQFNDDVWLSAKMGFARNHDCFLTSSQSDDVYADRRLFANARRFIEANPLPAMFMFLHTYKMHSPYEPGQEFLAGLGLHPRQLSMRALDRQAQFNSRVSAEDRRTMEELYDAEAHQFDYFLGDFIRFLKQSGLYERSLIVLLSDHGEEFGEHGAWFHGHSLYREIYHVPLLIKFPGQAYAGRRPEFVSLCDVLPTILDHMGIAPPATIDGISLLPMIRGSAQPPRTIFSSAVVSRFDLKLPRRFSLFSGPYQLIYNFPLPPEARAYYQEFGLPAERPEIELFDTRFDPQGQRDLSQQHREVIDSLRPDIARVIREYRRYKQSGLANDSLLDEEREQLRTLGYL
jgi:arylsulfatase A-like enzyme